MVRIIFLDPPSYMPTFMADDDGFYSLDLSEGQRIALTRQIDDYIDIGKIKQDTFLEVDGPITKKNRLLLGEVGNPSALNENNNKIFRIQLLKGDFSYPVSGLQLVDITDIAYSFTIFGELNEWYRPLKNLYLNQLEIGEDVVDYVYINNLHLNNWAYTPPLPPVFPPLANYGKWFVPTTLSVHNAPAQVVFENWRFWYNPFALIKQAFCQIGWELISPLFEEEEARRTYDYLLDPQFETEMDLNIAERPMELEKPVTTFFEQLFQRPASGIKLEGVVNIFEVVSDPGNHLLHNPPIAVSTENYWGGFYSGGIIGNFHTEGTIRINLTSGTLIPVAPEFITIRVIIFKSYRYGIEGQDDLLNKSTTLAVQEFIHKTPITSGVPLDFEFVVDTGQVKVYRNEVVGVRIEFDAFLTNTLGQTFTEEDLYDQTNILSGHKFSCTVTKQVLEEGDTVNFGQLLNKNITALELLKGQAHKYGLKIEQDSIGKKVFLFPEFPFDWYVSGRQEGFFKPNTDNPLDLTKLIQAKSMQEPLRNTDLQREIYLKFLNSTDGYILDMNLEQELHSKKIDLGPQYRDGENEVTNPFYEPLATGIDNRISGLNVTFGPGDTRNSVNYIPFLWESQSVDGNYPITGYEFAPRSGIAYPLGNNVRTQPELTGQSDFTISFYVYEDVAQPFYNLFGQIFPNGISIIQLGPEIFPNLANVYGNDSVNTDIPDLWELLYSRVVNQAYFGLALNFLVMLSLVEFSSLSFRRKILIKYKSAAWGEIIFFARLSQVQDYVIGDNLTTPIEVIPDNNNFLNNC